MFNEQEELIDIKAGDRVLIPERTLHREAPAVPGGNAVILIAFPKPMTPAQAVELDPDAL